MLYVPWRLLSCSGPQAVAQELLGGNRASRRCRARMRTDDSFQTCHTDGDGVVPVGNHFAAPSIMATGGGKTLAGRAATHRPPSRATIMRCRQGIDLQDFWRHRPSWLD